MRRRKRARSRERLARLRLLSDELDSLRGAAADRTRSIDTKSSFVVVAAGVLASATFTELVDARSWFVGLVPFALMTAAIVMAAIALWPAGVDAPSGRRLVSRWADTVEDASVLEDYLVEVKTKEIEHRDARNEKRAKATRAAFVLLVAGVATALLTAGLNAALMEGSHNAEGDPADASTFSGAP